MKQRRLALALHLSTCCSCHSKLCTDPVVDGKLVGGPFSINRRCGSFCRFTTYVIRSGQNHQLCLLTLSTSLWTPPHAHLRPQLLALLRAKQAIAAASKANASAKSAASPAVSATAPRAAAQHAGGRKPTVKVCASMYCSNQGKRMRRAMPF